MLKGKGTKQGFIKSIPLAHLRIYWISTQRISIWNLEGIFHQQQWPGSWNRSSLSISLYIDKGNIFQKNKIIQLDSSNVLNQIAWTPNVWDLLGMHPIDSSTNWFIPCFSLPFISPADPTHCSWFREGGPKAGAPGDWGFSYDRLPKNLRKHGKSCLRNETESPSYYDFKEMSKNKNTTSLPAANYFRAHFLGSCLSPN